MNNRAFTALPSSRSYRHLVTDVTAPFKRVFIDTSNNQAKSAKFGSNPVPRPHTTLPASRRNVPEPPSNFTWVDPGWLAACASPTCPTYGQVMHSYTLFKNYDAFPKLNQTVWFTKSNFKFGFVVQAVAVHCANGKGISGTMLACYLVKMKRISAADALKEIRRMRPGSVESTEQEKAVEQFYQSYIRGRS
uniref:COS41.7 n=1 Tax=Ciona intestinalis TaxID=7719 RepID=P91585_CIOIN|nr:COS41.7 [Ciona intestinalis]